MVDKISRAFALPSVMIASIVMFIVLGVAISSVSSVRNSLKDQFYQNIAKEASESGLAVASACISEGITSWSQIIPSSSCQHQSGKPSASTAEDWIIDKPEYRVTYVVKKDNNINDNYISTGRVELKRASNGSAWNVYEYSTKQLEQSSESRKLNWSSISVGAEHICGIASNAKVYCWGSNQKGQLGNGTNSNSTNPVAIQYGEIPAGSNILSVAAGGDHTCALASNAKVYCWGGGQYGVLGNGSTVDSNVPVAVDMNSQPHAPYPGPVSAKYIVSGFDHSCLLSINSKAYCWGRNSHGRLGDGTTVDRKKPVQVSNGALPSNVFIKKISSGLGDHTCALASDSKVYCWGRNNRGKLGDGTTADRSSPVLVNKGQVPNGVGFKHISTGSEHTCAIAYNDKAYCWGYGHSGRLGTGSGGDRYTPAAVVNGSMPPNTNIVSVEAGSGHTCAVAASGKAYCWGFGTFGQMGNGSNAAFNPSPVPVSSGDMVQNVGIKNVSVGTTHSCVVTLSNKAHCWGGLLSSMHTSINHTPFKIADINDDSDRPLVVDSLSSGDGTNCAIGSDSWVYCWGSNANSRLGASAPYGNKTPVRVARGEVPPEAIIQKVSTGATASCALASDGWVYCWGVNSKVAGSGRAKAIARGHIPIDEKIVDISVGGDTACVIASDHKVYCWGEGRNYALGRGFSSETSSNIPLLLHVGQRPDLKAQKISVGNGYGCLIGSNGKVYCWGEGFYGRLANGSYSNHNQTPTEIQRGWLASDYFAHEVSTGINNTCMISSDTKVYCWGSNNRGQSGAGVSQGMLTSPRRTHTISGIDKVYVSKGLSDASVCAIRYISTEVYCWGSGQKYNLGNNSTANSNIPKAVHNGHIPSGVPILDVSAGGQSGCTLTAHFRAYCWGNNDSGQVGNQDAPLTTVPVPNIVSDLPNYGYESNRRYLY